MKHMEILAPEAAALRPEVMRLPRVSVRGKFLFCADDKLYIKGVTYGTFRPGEDGIPFPAREAVDRDFSLMAASGINAVRLYTVPPSWLLDLALLHGLRVMVGLPWEQHIAFLNQRGLPADIERRIRSAVRQCCDHPAILCFVVGNEIPASIVRWYGPRRIERFIRRLYRAAKDAAPTALVTYVNYPTTEYLSLPFLDFCCFNVYLEDRAALESYIAQLQNLAGDRPLVLTEVGFDSRNNGEMAQAETLAWQIQTIFTSGCAGAFVFAWTDEWHRGGYNIEDWDFGLVTRDRVVKPSLQAVQSAFADVPFAADVEWPEISVIVCTYNGSRTLRECLEGLRRLEYPRYEVIVVDDGSTDHSAAIAGEYPFRLVRLDHCGLSAARNAGMDAARGQILAYIDDDASPDPHWLHYLAWTYLQTDYVAVGGPNIGPTEDGPIAKCVALAPGAPAHVLTSHREAEHIPGCNCSFRRDHLMAIGGFDARFRTAGDDVDVCWRLIERGWKIGFHAGAMVWHHRRSSIRAYLKQQRGYGRAETLLEAKWPSRYNEAGRAAWQGRIYENRFGVQTSRGPVFYGAGGSALFQRMYNSHPGHFERAWSALSDEALVHDRWRYRLLTALLHILQPFARFAGRVSQRLASRKRLTLSRWVPLRGRVLRIWSEEWKAPEAWLSDLETTLQTRGAIVRRGGDFDRWDLEVRGGVAANARVMMAVEEHGGGRQMLLFDVRPSIPASSMWAPGLAGALAVLAFLLGFTLSAIGAGAAALVCLYHIIVDCSYCAAEVHHALQAMAVQSHDSVLSEVRENAGV